MTLVFIECFLFHADNPVVKPFIISVWYGEGKPTPVNDFLRAFVHELNDLIVNGIVINGYNIGIRVRCFICDTPARSLLKGKSFLPLVNDSLSFVMLLTVIFIEKYYVLL